MSTETTGRPQIPPRPVRPEAPPIPARPHDRHADLDTLQDHFPRSPFNEPPSNLPSSPGKPSSLYASSRNASTTALVPPDRPPSVALPSIGQEGTEYATVDYDGAAELTHNVASDLPLHAPKPTLGDPSQRLAAVARTESIAATAPMPPPRVPSRPDSPVKEAKRHSLRAAAREDRPGSSLTDDEHGGPEIGQRVPMYPDAGVVQAPSPSPFQQVFPPGVGFHNSGAKKPNKPHRRTPSGREVLPPDSYGMHGHGVPSSDHFEKQWYAKHPDELEREEHGEYGPGIGGGRGEWALSSDDLNKLVRDTAAKAQITAGLPNEQIGYQASEEYASRLQSPLSATFKPQTPDSRHAESALRHSSVAGNENDPPMESLHAKVAAAAKERTTSKYAVPILASDELARTPGAEFLQPAVSNMQSPIEKPEEKSHQVDPVIFTDSTALDQVQEYEPLFPEGEDESKPNTVIQRLKMREQMKRFPSQDIWEDTPGSLQLHATVDTPEPQGTQAPPPTRDAATPFETPAQEAARKGEPTEEEKGKLLSREERLVKSTFKPHLQEEMHRPGMKQRFPSRDIWEDSPDSAELTTEVGRSPPTDAGHEAGAIVHTIGRPSEGHTPVQSRHGATAGVAAMALPNDLELSSSNGSADSPKVPARPAEKSHQVPALPSADATDRGSDTERLSKVVSGSSVGSNDSNRSKPAVPPRPVGSKIAALQSGFMADLNSRLRIGPTAPKAAKEEEEQVLTDARKGRAKGPTKRRPANAPAAPQWCISTPVTIWQTNRSGAVELHGQTNSNASHPSEETDTLPEPSSHLGEASEVPLPQQTL